MRGVWGCDCSVDTELYPCSTCCSLARCLQPASVLMIWVPEPRSDREHPCADGPSLRTPEQKSEWARVPGSRNSLLATPQSSPQHLVQMFLRMLWNPSTSSQEHRLAEHSLRQFFILLLRAKRWTHPGGGNYPTISACGVPTPEHSPRSGTITQGSNN